MVRSRGGGLGSMSCLVWWRAGLRRFSRSVGRLYLLGLLSGTERFARMLAGTR
jgi:hypothetical protein